MFNYRSRAHQSGASRVGPDKRENFAMRDRARKGEQGTVAAKKRQRVGQRDEGLLQDVVGLVARGAERIRDEPTDARGVPIEKLVRRGLVASLEPCDEISLGSLRRIRRAHERNSPLRRFPAR